VDKQEESKLQMQDLRATRPTLPRSDHSEVEAQSRRVCSGGAPEKIRNLAERPPINLELLSTNKSACNWSLSTSFGDSSTH
jgi:hypothetical protein